MDIAAVTPIPKFSLGTCVDSGATNDYSPDWPKLQGNWSRYNNSRQICHESNMHGRFAPGTTKWIKNDKIYIFK